MALPVPNLDDRKFQDFVDEAKRRIPRYAPQWTDHNVSDPGVTLIELFAWMTEQMIFRLNQVPDKNFVTFLELLGVGLQPAQPARGDVTFMLSAAPRPDRRAIIPAWTETATERTETLEAVVFTTDTDAEVLPPQVRWLLTSADGDEFQDQAATARGETALDVWANPPRASNAMYLGFDADLSRHVLVLQFQCDRVGIGIDPERPPWKWEVWRGNEFKWETVEVASDTTLGLNQNGEVRLHLPYACQPARPDRMREARTWIRCAPLDQLPPGRAPYARAPRIRRASAYTIGITVPVTHAQPVGPEVLGYSAGQPAQRFRLQNRNILKPQGSDEIVEVAVTANNWEPWTMVPHFGDSGPEDRHYMLDSITGEVSFGPAVRQRNGAEPQFGAIPPQASQIRIRRYRIGGGVRGNVAAGRVKVLKTTLPYVASVTNRADITGGLEAQSLDDAKLRAPSLLRTRFRAVTSEDYEYLAREVEGVGRVRCLQPRPDDPSAPPPNTVQILVIPALPALTDSELERQIELHEALAQENRRAGIEGVLQAQLRLTPSTEFRLREYLDERRMLTTRIQIGEPQYVWVTVQTRIRVAPKAEPERVRRDVKAALYRFLNPMYGGGGGGWPFGKPLTIDKVYALIQEVPGVDYATGLDLYPINLTDPKGQRLGKSEQVINVPPNGVIVSYYHNVYSA
ncbi:MAG: putative baseplate assembly protein [Chloroflexi bacterium]|nr:putative baseplate assembly protein [Chloroflexota bacterium]